MIILEIIKKLLKICNPNISAEVLFIHAIIEDDFDLKVKNIEYKPASAEVFATRADV
jgi:hypothetical protein